MKFVIYEQIGRGRHSEKSQMGELSENLSKTIYFWIPRTEIITEINIQLNSCPEVFSYKNGLTFF